MTRLASRTSRLRDIETMLLMTPNGLPVQTIAERLAVTRRTIYRDLSFLEGQGVPLWQEDGRFGINRTRYLANVRLTFHEAMSLVLAGLLLSRTIDERNPHVIAALRKLGGVLPANLVSQLDRAIERVQAQSSDYRPIAVLEALTEGWGTGRKVRIQYRSPRSGEIRPRTIAPYALEPTPSGIYVIGHDEWADDLRTFKLDRLETATVLDQSYQIPDSFDLEAHLATGWRIMAGETLQEVVVRFTPEVTARVLERQWHATQQVEQCPDGACILRVQIAEPLEMMPWIRSWGGEAKVLQPDWLQQEILADLHRALAAYQETGNGRVAVKPMPRSL
ncbi:MAG: transcriptional regulator [Chloroflexota bacterium]|jgi:predicted DNA-binding transcriptional regulator YafY